MQLGLVRKTEQVDDDASGVQPNRLLNRIFNQRRKKMIGKSRTVYVGYIGPHHERGLGAWDLLEEASRARRELNGVGGRRHNGLDRGAKILDAAEETRLVKEAVVYGDIKTLAIGGKETVKAGGACHAPEFSRLLAW